MSISCKMILMDCYKTNLLTFCNICGLIFFFAELLEIWKIKNFIITGWVMRDLYRPTCRLAWSPDLNSIPFHMSDLKSFAYSTPFPGVVRVFKMAANKSSKHLLFLKECTVLWRDEWKPAFRQMSTSYNDGEI